MKSACFYKRMEAYLGDEFPRFKELMEQPHYQSIFFNTLKAPLQTLVREVDFEIEATDYNPFSYYIKHDSIGKTIQNDLGLFYPQEVSASIPAQVLNPRKGSIVVDMCSAPGGKSINLANILEDDGLLISNEYEYKRATILVSNLERMGISNVIVTNKNGEDLAKALKGYADYVLLDAPCSGEGMIRKQPTILDDYNLGNIELCHNRSLELIENAYDILKENGEMVYSTCTYAIEENEAVVYEFLKKHPDVELLDIDHSYPRRGLKYQDLDSSKLVRFTPLDKTEGQFIAHFKKRGENTTAKIKNKKAISNKLIEKFLEDQIDLKNYYIYEQNEKYYLALKEMPDLGRNVLRYGIALGEIRKNVFYPEHHFYRSNILNEHMLHLIDIDDEDYSKIISGNSIYKDVKNGYYALTYKHYPLSFTKVSNGECKNKYPKGLRR